MMFRRMTLCDVFLEVARRLRVDARRATYQLDLTQVGASTKFSGGFRPDPGAGPFFATALLDRGSVGLDDTDRTVISVAGRVVIDMLGNFLADGHESLAAPLLVPGHVSVECSSALALSWKATVPGFHVRAGAVAPLLEAFGGQAWARTLSLTGGSAIHQKDDFIFERPTFLARLRSNPDDTAAGALVDDSSEMGFLRLALVTSMGERQEILAQPYRDNNLSRQLRVNRHLPPGARLEAELQNFSVNPRSLLLHMIGTQPW